MVVAGFPARYHRESSLESARCRTQADPLADFAERLLCDNAGAGGTIAEDFIDALRVRRELRPPLAERTQRAVEIARQPFHAIDAAVQRVRTALEHLRLFLRRGVVGMQCV